MLLIPITNWSTVDPNGIVINLAEQSPEDFKLGAIICDKKGRIVATGYNKNTTHPRFGSGPYKMIHAEGAALWACEKLGVDPRGHTMYVFRQRHNMSKPCLACQALLQEHGISKVYYSKK